MKYILFVLAFFMLVLPTFAAQVHFSINHPEYKIFKNEVQLQFVATNPSCKHFNMNTLSWEPEMEVQSFAFQGWNRDYIFRNLYGMCQFALSKLYFRLVYPGVEDPKEFMDTFYIGIVQDNNHLPDLQVRCETYVNSEEERVRLNCGHRDSHGMWVERANLVGENGSSVKILLP